jgi:hypothetical protein
MSTSRKLVNPKSYIKFLAQRAGMYINEAGGGKEAS